jgi:hypothetical protein
MIHEKSNLMQADPAKMDSPIRQFLPLLHKAGARTQGARAELNRGEANGGRPRPA